jgi:hypothetical protein
MFSFYPMPNEDEACDDRKYCKEDEKRAFGEVKVEWNDLEVDEEIEDAAKESEKSKGEADVSAFFSIHTGLS